MIQYLKLGSLTRIRTGKLDANAADDNGTYPFFTCSREPLSINTCSYDCECVLVAGNGDLNVKYYDGKFDAYQRTYIIESLDKTKLMVKYLYYFLDLYVEILRQQAIGGVIKYIKLGNLADAIIPVPVIEKQREIIEIFEKCNGTIAYRQQELLLMDQLVKSRFIEMFGNEIYPVTPLINLIKEGAGLSYGIVQPGNDGTGDMGILRPVDMVEGKISAASIKYISRDIGDSFKKTELTGDELLITVRGTTGITALTDGRFVGMNVTRGIAVIRYDRRKINPIYLKTYLNTDKSQRYIQEHTRGATLQQINLSDLRIQEIPVPPMTRQEKMAAFVEQVDKSKFEIQQSLEKLEILKKSLMQQYFG